MNKNMMHTIPNIDAVHHHGHSRPCYSSNAQFGGKPAAFKPRPRVVRQKKIPVPGIPQAPKIPKPPRIPKPKIPKVPKPPKIPKEKVPRPPKIPKPRVEKVPKEKVEREKAETVKVENVPIKVVVEQNCVSSPYKKRKLTIEPIHYFDNVQSSENLKDSASELKYVHYTIQKSLLLLTYIIELNNIILILIICFSRPNPNGRSTNSANFETDPLPLPEPVIKYSFEWNGDTNNYALVPVDQEEEERDPTLPADAAAEAEAEAEKPVNPHWIPLGPNINWEESNARMHGIKFQIRIYTLQLSYTVIFSSCVYINS